MGYYSPIPYSLIQGKTTVYHSATSSLKPIQREILSTLPFSYFSHLTIFLLLLLLFFTSDSYFPPTFSIFFTSEPSSPTLSKPEPRSNFKLKPPNSYLPTNPIDSHPLSSG
ncbi:hypothetical protein ES332_A03G061500v1 [Gossypium tomentosum]|uniref:Uncharacterized protein n=1 Tax=Gossypium tomentosum TaxID=34277 RepID=A0A5D2R4Q6_GOSTO|nr:hypothetical protein ES332_A03G061500v1 [Gossypium tomentosum]